MGSLAAVFGLSLLDSLNPSALLVTAFLLLNGGSYGRRVLTYVAAIFGSYLLLGVLIMTGMTALADLADNLVVQRVGHALMAVGGLAMLGYALFAPDRTDRPARRRLPTDLALPAIFALGVTITLVEFVTALPYLAALGILTASGFGLATWLPVLIAYNVVFVLPPVLLMLFWRIAGHRLRPRVERFLDKERGRGLLLWGLGLVGFFLARQGIVYYLGVFGVVRI